MNEQNEKIKHCVLIITKEGVIDTGTNFYFFTKDKNIKNDYFVGCGMIVDEPEFGYQIHIAKTSCGWLPLFQANDECRSVRMMKKIYDLGGVQIFDEYGEEYTWEQFDERVLQFNGGKKGVKERRLIDGEYEPISHLEYEHGKYRSYYFVDSDGYEFSKEWFC